MYRPNPKRKPRRRQRGLTLIEILVVVTILGIIASIVGITVGNALGDARVDAARIQIGKLTEALDLYKVKFHRYPTTQEGLNAMVTPPSGKGSAIMEKVPRDPWDADYVYVSPGQHNPTKFDLQSKGPDGVADTTDDVSNW